MLIAAISDEDTHNLIVAATGLIIASTVLANGLAAFIQSWLQRKRDREDATELKQITAEKADAVAQKVIDGTAHLDKQLNGSGLGGAVAELREWADDHESKDENRHQENMAMKKSILAKL